ncbi:hypothetical protein [Natrinema sp. 1APR25-10V2]|uniref:DUF7344 domain-containing protein n=1 Tax=Natrinema sp. 1APR25-10V2 TaxID=2951081 RepID=UPI0028770B34|nr:hypothetical protein [Natrinema sp. 1APR25-10V2]MDS0473513.1 hypothetical protein [Natrinema sp. 1APR25-10V2]
MAKRSEGEDASDELSLDAILDVLSHHHRRTLFRWVRDQPKQQADSQALIDHLIQQEHERMGKTPNPDHIQAALYHIHLPKLSETELVTHDEAAQEYQYHSNDRLEKWLELIDSEHESEW